MSTRRTRHHASASTLQLLVAAAMAATAGVALYAWQRPRAAMFLPPNWHQALPPVLPQIWIDVLPTLLHVVALSLACIAVLSVRDRTRMAGTCAAWVVIDVALELLQHPWPALPRLTGTFDPLDLVAAVAGGAVAFAIAGTKADPSSAAVPRRARGGAPAEKFEAYGVQHAD